MVTTRTIKNSPVNVPKTIDGGTYRLAGTQMFKNIADSLANDFRKEGKKAKVRKFTSRDKTNVRYGVYIKIKKSKVDYMSEFMKEFR